MSRRIFYRLRDRATGQFNTRRFYWLWQNDDSWYFSPGALQKRLQEIKGAGVHNQRQIEILQYDMTPRAIIPVEQVDTVAEIPLPPELPQKLRSRDPLKFQIRDSRTGLFLAVPGKRGQPTEWGVRPSLFTRSSVRHHLLRLEKQVRRLEVVDVSGIRPTSRPAVKWRRPRKETR